MTTSTPPTGAAPGSGVGAPSAAGNTYGRAFLASLVWAGAGLVLVVILLAGDPRLPETIGAGIAQFTIAALLSAWATWAIARRGARWAFWRLVVLALPFFVLASLVLTAIRSR